MALRRASLRLLGFYGLEINILEKWLQGFSDRSPLYRHLLLDYPRGISRPFFVRESDRPPSVRDAFIP